MFHCRVPSRGWWELGLAWRIGWVDLFAKPIIFAAIDGYRSRGWACPASDAPPILRANTCHELITLSEDAAVTGERDAASGLVANTVLYGLPNTNTFEVRQMIRSNFTNVRIFSRYFHNTRCWTKFHVRPQAQNGSRR